MNESRIVKLKLDIIFKRVFGNAENEKVIIAFIADLLEIPKESIQSIYIENVEMTPEYLDQKFSRLDLKLTIDDKIVNIEMQLNREADFKDRTLFYWSKLYSEELKTGDEYGELKQTICINIINFDLFDCEDYHSNFKILENERHELLTDKFAIHFFELKKLSKFKKKRRMEDWLNLINAETEDDLMALQQTTTIPEVKETIVKLREMSADEQLRRQAFYREKRLHDEASALGTARREGIAEGLAEGLAKGREEGKAEGMAKGREEGKAEGMAKGREEGRALESARIAEQMRKYGVSEENIKLFLGK